MCCQIDDISNEIIIKIRIRIWDFKYFFLAFSKSTDISCTDKFLIFVRGVNESFQIIEEIFKLLSLKDTTKGKAIFHAVENWLSENNLGLGIHSGIQLMVHLLLKKEL